MEAVPRRAAPVVECSRDMPLERMAPMDSLINRKFNSAINGSPFYLSCRVWRVFASFRIFAHHSSIFSQIGRIERIENWILVRLDIPRLSSLPPHFFGASLIRFLNCFKGEITYSREICNFARISALITILSRKQVAKTEGLRYTIHGYRELKDCVVLMDLLVKTFAPLNGQDCMRNGFMAGNVVRKREVRS